MQQKFAKAGWELKVLGKPADDGSRSRRVFLVGEPDIDKAVGILRALLGPEADVNRLSSLGRADSNLLARLYVLPGECEETWPYSPFRLRDVLG